jgi:uncharacterized repeat protein (TIGR02543 family)
VDYIEPNNVLHADGWVVPEDDTKATVHASAWPADANDPYYSATTNTARKEQWDLKSAGNGIYANGAWQRNLLGDGITVAIIDSGINRNHEDLDNTKIKTGWTFLTFSATSRINQAGAVDDFGHGTHVSSTIAARTNNGKGIAGMVQNVTLLPIKSLRSDGTGMAIDFISALDYAMNQGADVVNASLGISAAAGTYGGFQAMQEKVDQLYNKGIIVIAAAGNDGNSLYNYPASNAHVVGVGSTGSTGGVSKFSNFNGSVTVTAPGEEIIGSSHTGNNAYLTMGGTSMATPHVAALAAIGKQIAVQRGFVLNADSFSNLLRDSAIDKGTAGYDVYYGYGLINVESYINRALSAATWDQTLSPRNVPDTDAPYNIYYTLTGGTLPAGAPTSYRPSKGVTFPIPRRKGYAFRGWYNTLGNGPYFGLAAGIYGDYSASARWLRITLNAGGGKVASSDLIFLSNGKPENKGVFDGLPSATRKGYTFKGWYSAKTDGFRVTKNKLVTVPDNPVIYARWAANSYKVSLKVNGGKKLKKTTYTFKYGKKYKGLPTPSRKGYRFAGWYTAKKGGTKISASSTVKITKKTTLYARWKKR